MSLVITATNLSKRYSIHIDRAFRTFRDTLADAFRNTPKDKLVQKFWALQNISFSIRAGECVGIVGRNGAGKSTLLKILSRVTLPTSGKVVLRGRVASLLELGTGFHPELTGRENIILNATILGESQQNIRRKMDAIIDFSGVETFIDTPIKRYSSGMQTRLGFAVASHIEGEILIVDEAISTGDFDFKKKCTMRIHEILKSGRTVLLVSHEKSSLEELCSRIIHVAQGQIVQDSTDVEQALATYLETPLAPINKA